MRRVILGWASLPLAAGAWALASAVLNTPPAVTLVGGAIIGLRWARIWR